MSHFYPASGVASLISFDTGCLFGQLQAFLAMRQTAAMGEERTFSFNCYSFRCFSQQEVVRWCCSTGRVLGVETVIAFALSGKAELVVLALTVGADFTFVAMHHILLIFVANLGAPAFARWTH